MAGGISEPFQGSWAYLGPRGTEGEIKYIPFIAYLDALRDPRGVKSCATIH